MPDDHKPLSVNWIEARIIESRGQRVLLDIDLARVYGVTNKRLAEQVRRNAERFPEDFAWVLPREELNSLRPQIAAAKPGRGGRRTPPWVFTEHGAVMLANVLKSPAAILASVEIVRAFVRLRCLAAEHHSLSRRLDELEQRYDIRFKAVFDAVRQLLESPRQKRGRIGFGLGDDPGGPTSSSRPFLDGRAPSGASHRARA
jgi:hypothetical protein